MKVPYLNLVAEFNTEPVWQAVKTQLESCWFVGGPATESFEKKFAELCGSRFAIGVNSGTDGLFLPLKALCIGEGDEVITVSNSFIASAGAIAAAGARPVFVDVGADYQMDPDCLKAALTPRTKAIMPVHLTGLPADMERINAFAAEAGLHVIEDAAQAVGASIGEKKVGTFGIASAFSLHPLKNLNVAGDGGVITTDDEELRERLLQLRNHGLVDRNEAAAFGFNSRLDCIQAAIGEVMLDRLPETNRKRIANADRYDSLLADMEPRVIRPQRRDGTGPVFHTYVILCERRNELQAFLGEHGVETKIHYPVPIHMQGAGRALGYGPGDLPVTEDQCTRILTLPVNQHISGEQLEFVADRIKAFYA